MASVSRRELKQLIDEEKNGPNPIRTTAPEIEHTNWTDKKSGKTHRVPKGIDPGWAYHPGKQGFKDTV